MLKNIKSFLKYIIYFSASLVSRFYGVKVKNKTLLLCRIDGIGDYLLFRNLLPTYRDFYKDLKISILIDEAITSFVEEFDRDFVDELINIDKKKFENNLIYFLKTIVKIRKKGFFKIVNPIYSRTFVLDLLVFNSASVEKIGYDGDYSNQSWLLLNINKKIYSRVIYSEPRTIFELDRNIEFATKIGMKLSSDFRLCLLENNQDRKNIIIFPGSSQIATQWNKKNYMELISYLLSNYDFEIIICGSKFEYSLGQYLAQQNTKRVLNYCGKTTLVQFAYLVSSSRILISNDTSAVHIAAAVSTQFVCISSGKHFIRYSPYPENYGVKGYSIYPTHSFYDVFQKDILAEKNRYKSVFKVDEVKINDVIDKVNKVLI